MEKTKHSAVTTAKVKIFVITESHIVCLMYLVLET